MHDEIAVSGAEGFRPRYDMPGKDYDRLIEHVAELAHQGRIARVPGLALIDTHVGPAFDKVIDGYFAKGLYAELEAHYTHSELYATWPFEGEMARWRQLVGAGQKARVIRLWRNHIACLKVDFWYRVNERKAGFRKPKFSGMSDEEDRASYEELITKIPRRKEDILGVMAFARDWFERIGASEADLARLAADRAEIEAEERRRPQGKPDPRAMDPDVFWEVIGTPGDGGIAAQIEGVAARLERFKATPIKTFDTHLQTLHAAAYRQDLWALAYLLKGGCSDDSFAAFRCWLILQGQAAFEDTLADPDGVDIARFSSDFDGALALLDAPLLAYEARSGKAMKRKILRVGPLVGNDPGEDAYERLLPRVAAQLVT